MNITTFIRIKVQSILGVDNLYQVKENKLIRDHELIGFIQPKKLFTNKEICFLWDQFMINFDPKSLSIKELYLENLDLFNIHLKHFFEVELITYNL